MNPEKNNPWKLLETSLNLGEIRKILCKKKQKMIKNKIKIRFCIQWNVIIVYWNYEAWKLGENIPFLTQSWLRNLKMLREVVRDFLSLELFFIWCLSKTGNDIATFSLIYHRSLMVKVWKLNIGTGFLRMLPGNLDDQ